MQSSSNSLRTLKGVFEVPKMNHRRDFLRENKLNLRELQKNTTQKLTQQKVEQQKQQSKHLQRYQNQKSQEHFAGRRSNSQQRYNGEDLRQKQPQRAPGGGNAGINVGDNGGGGGARDDGRPNRISFRRSYSQQRESCENLRPTYPAASFDNYGHNHQHTDMKESHVPRSASVASIISKAESCDKEIQTEDIIDEDFLYEALKKCSSTEVDFRSKHARECERIDPTVSRSNISLHSQHTKYEDNKSTHSREHINYDHRDHNGPGDNKNFHDPQYTERSEYTHHMHNGHNQMERNNQHTQEDVNLGEQFQNLHINPQAARECETQSSARSRQTMFSNISNKKSNGNYKLDREDIRLPRYLEKEKREKEVERVREMSRDPNCPLGHYALAEEERLAALNASQKKMESLIQELNRMPMTTETLRIRSRKVEIEKEIQQIELDIRAFSKSKVYVAEPSMQY